MTPPLNPWRTVITTLAVCAMQTCAFAFADRHGWTVDGATAFGSLCLWSTIAATGQAAKALGEHLGNGSGLKGALASLMTDAKPGTPAP